MKKQTYLKVTFRDIAKMLASALPVEGQEFGIKVNEYVETIKAMTPENKTALKVAYIFSRKVPREERQDLFQDIAVTLLEAKNKDEKLSYAIARCDWKNWWSKYTIRQHYSLDSEGNSVTLAELLVGEVECENRLNGELEAQRMFDKLPDKIKPLIDKRLIGYALNNSERNILNRYVKAEGYKLILNTD